MKIRKPRLFMTPTEKAEEAEETRSAHQEREEEQRRLRTEGSSHGQARMAFDRGLDWFEIRMNIRGGKNSRVAQRSNAARDTQSVTLIENEGWRLVGVNHVFVPASSNLIDSSGRYSVDGEIVGIYMFRRDASKRHKP